MNNDHKSTGGHVNRYSDKRAHSSKSYNPYDDPERKRRRDQQKSDNQRFGEGQNTSERRQSIDDQQGRNSQQGTNSQRAAGKRDNRYRGHSRHHGRHRNYDNHREHWHYSSMMATDECNSVGSSLSSTKTSCSPPANKLGIKRHEDRFSTKEEIQASTNMTGTSSLNDRQLSFINSISNLGNQAHRAKEDRFQG